MSARSLLLDRLRLPVIAAPMFLVSGPALVIAACRAGVIGAFPTPNARTSGQLDQWLGEIAGALDGEPDCAPFAVNLLVHRTNQRLSEDLALIVKHRAPIVITALGAPAQVISAIHSYGGIVLADVNSVVHARKAAGAGADGLVLIAAGAGGHTGKLSPFAFVPAVRKFFSGPLVVGGGIADGRGVRAVQVLGADLAYVGTRFIASRESMAPAGHKQMLIDCAIEDVVESRAVTGIAANWLRPSLDAYNVDPEAVAAVSFDQPEVGGKRWKDIWAAGQGVGAVESVEALDVIVDKLVLEYTASDRRAAEAEVSFT